jgi:RNA polymerase sigma-70 factor (sigma-E family)
MRDEFEEFAVAAWPRLRHAGWLLTGHDHDAEDLASTALARTYASWRRIRGGDPYAYARRCLVNAQIDRVRRSRGREVVSDTVPERPTPNGEGVTEDRAQLAQLLAILSDRERRVVVLRYYFDRSEAQVAAELDVSVGTVKSTASRALAKLRVSDPVVAATSDISEGVTR